MSPQAPTVEQPDLVTGGWFVEAKSGPCKLTGPRELVNRSSIDDSTFVQALIDGSAILGAINGNHAYTQKIMSAFAMLHDSGKANDLLDLVVRSMTDFRDAQTAALGFKFRKPGLHRVDLRNRLSSSPSSEKIGHSPQRPSVVDVERRVFGMDGNELPSGGWFSITRWPAMAHVSASRLAARMLAENDLDGRLPQNTGRDREPNSTPHTTISAPHPRIDDDSNWASTTTSSRRPWWHGH